MFNSEEEILACSISELDAFPVTAEPIKYGNGKFQTQVPSEVLKYYKVGKAERDWASSNAKKTLEGERLVLGQLNRILYRLNSEQFGKADDYFAAKFPLFNDVISKFQLLSPSSFFSRKVMGAGPFELI